MKKLFTALFWALFVSNALAYEITGKVVGVADGDTLTILDATNVQHKIRLADIDAPESGQPYGNRAKQRLRALVAGKSVTADCREKDKYGRDVCTVIWLRPVMRGSMSSTTHALTCRRYKRRQKAKERGCGHCQRRKL